jgi:ectoine hydroxylase-related dioxygenase (phytanoyl-CoA dioxygenase family)
MRAEDRYLFDLHGYLVIKGALTEAELARINATIDTLPESAAIVGKAHAHRGLEGSSGTRSLLDWGRPLRDLVNHPSITPCLTELLGHGFRLDHQYAIIQNNTPGTRVGNPLHGGGTPFRPAEYCLVRDNRFFNGMVVTSFALTDVPPGAGGFCCIPGSHHSSFPLPPSLRALDERASPVLQHVPLNAGDALIFTEALTHGTLPWQAAHERRALLFKYCPGHMQWHPSSPSWEGDDWTEDQRRVLRGPYVQSREPSIQPSRTAVKVWLYRQAIGARGWWRSRHPDRYLDDRG